MAVKLPALTPARIIAILSILLNILGGTGTVKPLMGETDPECPVVPAVSHARLPAPPPPAIEPPSN